ncbi:hypothetical protein [Aquimarina brevivitae]|uniref:Thrombospondin type 3 repeat-containing protein n=1 Tax=Aquimarina brevivitae TaxID=323412 RepID=A0A4Q7NTU1_9FLAO|nr:hypothetical protein [Aquimarina brevivitae]RZS90444.1 hypothetical protein EV197_3429 [Aquimarina brevivitae]
MKNLFRLLKITVVTFIGGFIVSSCDDGDIIITNFEFDDATLQLCTGANPNEYVFFKINSDINESISFNFTSTDYEANVTTSSGPIEIQLSPENPLIYRQYSAAITADYFCSTIPPAEIEVVNELVITEGKAILEVIISNEDDNDGVPAEEEDLNNDNNLENDDTDGDTIPNYKDQDDDNDNVLTSAELPNSIPGDDSYRDTDEDGIPDYLDDDDDMDGIPSIEEDVDGNGTPRNDDRPDIGQQGIIDYLDDEADISYFPDPHPEITLIPNTVITTFRTSVRFVELVAPRNAELFTETTFTMGSREVTESITN